MDPELIEQPLYLIAALALILLVSDWLSRSRMLRSFGIALTVIVLGAVFSNTGLIPTGPNPTYDSIFTYIAPGGLFLLLLDVNLAQLRQTGLPILVLFLLGSLGTVCGVLLSTVFIEDGSLFKGMYAPLAGMFTGTYTGGSINFNAVALHYEVMEEGMVYTSAVAVDNVLTTVWFFATISLPVALQRLQPRQQGSGGQRVEVDSLRPKTSDEAARLDIKTLSFYLGLTCFALLASQWLTDMLEAAGLEIPFMIILTTLALLLAQIRALRQFRGNMFLGSWAIYLFLAVVGAYCDFSAIAAAGGLALQLLVLVLITVSIHGVLTFGGAWLLGYDWELASIASQANVGGGTTAMALAKNFGRESLILPAIIIGSLGNALGTYLGFWVAAWV